MNKEISRQLLHVSGIVILIIGLFLKIDVLILLCIIMVVTVEMLFVLDKHMHIPLFSNILSICKRSEDEKGFIYFFLGITTTLFIFSFNLSIAYAAILMLLIGDSVSTLVGKRFGNHKLPYNKLKSYEGTTSFFIVSFVCSLNILPPEPVFVGAIVGALTEAYSPIDDNIPIPIISAVAMTIMIYII